MAGPECISIDTHPFTHAPQRATGDAMQVSPAEGSTSNHNKTPTRRLFSLPDPPSGLMTPSASPKWLSRTLSALSPAQSAVLAGGPITQIHNCRVLRSRTITPDDVWFQDGRIINPTLLYGLRGPDVRIDGKGLIAAPGLVDVQLNGAFGYDFSSNSDNIGECMDAISRGILLQGCTSFCPTAVSSMPETYRRILPHIGRRPGSLQNGAESLGAHVEGPFMNPHKKGAHELACLRAAPHGLADFDECYGLDNLREHVAYMTVAPELEGVLDAIPQLIQECGIGISQGHSLATNKVASEAHSNGAKMITHLYNAMGDFHHRDPGIIGLLGAEGPAADACQPARSFYGLICDGIHVHPSSVRIAYNSHPQGVVLVSDAMGAMGLPDGQYNLGNMSVDVGPVAAIEGKPRAAVIQGTDTLAGSIVSLIECVRNFQAYAHCSAAAAIDAATLHPAQMLGIEHKKGTLAYGADADIILLTDDLYIKHVFVDGVRATAEDHK
ncbi:N-acetyl-glucosamine-6-phosphate deacetylase [Coemansia sp. RSA 552]|nr:N-acetyl-glucosamine-6-phosphate deacetylase [Coemansia sp. RSA 552]